MDGEHAGKAHHGGDRSEIAQRLIGQFLVEPWIDHQRRVGTGGDGVAIRLRLDQRLQPDRPVGAAAVLDIDLLAERLRQVLCRQPCDEVGAATGRERHDHLDRALRPRLCQNSGGQGAYEEQRGSEPCQLSMHGVSSRSGGRRSYCSTAAATASPIWVVLALPPRSGVSTLASAMTLAIAASIRSAASTAFGSTCLRPSQPSSIWPDMIMA